MRTISRHGNLEKLSAIISRDKNFKNLFFYNFHLKKFKNFPHFHALDISTLDVILSSFGLFLYLKEFSCFTPNEPISLGFAKISIVEEYEDLVRSNRKRDLRDSSIVLCIKISARNKGTKKALSISIYSLINEKNFLSFGHANIFFWRFTIK